MISITLASMLLYGAQAPSSGPFTVTPDTLTATLENQLEASRLRSTGCHTSLEDAWREALSLEARRTSTGDAALDIENLIGAADTAFLEAVAPIADGIAAVFDPLNSVYVFGAERAGESANDIERELRLAFTQDQFWRAFNAPRAAQGQNPTAITETLVLKRICAVDAANADWIRSRLDVLITQDAFESGTVRASFTLALHADERPALQLEALDALISAPLDDAFDADRLRRAARLADRILLNHDQAQLFGTAWTCHAGIAQPFGALTEASSLAANRAAFGLIDIETRRQERTERCQ
jgi:hypothetical protein